MSRDRRVSPLLMVHLARDSLSYVSHKGRETVADGLKQVYQAPALEEAERQFTEFKERWETIYPVIARSWRSNWARVTPMLSYPQRSSEPSAWRTPSSL